MPALAATAAACLAPQAMADPVSAHAVAGRAVVADAASHASLTAELLPAKQHAAANATQPAQPATYTVQPGDSLSAIAGRLFHKQAAWPVLYWANRGQVRWADLIQTGQVLHVPAKPAQIPAAPAQLAPAAPAPVATASAAVQPAPAQQASTDGDGDSDGDSSDVQAAPVQQASSEGDSSQGGSSQAGSSQGGSSQSSGTQQASTQGSSTWSGSYPGGSFGQCVVSRESGGNPQVMNSTGHYGLYQFSASTWAAYGGNPADFGNASVSEQNQVFANALAQGGQSNWAPYDGC